MDNTIVDTTGGVHTHWAKVYEEVCPLAPIEKQNHFWIPTSSEEESVKLEKIFHMEGFFLNLEAIPNALGAVEYLMEKHLVYFASRATLEAPFAVYEKALWLRKHLGKKAMDRSIFMIDKTVLSGDMLIDDAPEISGELQGRHAFEHVIYTQNYNKHKVANRRISWSNWQDILGELV